VSGSSDVTGSEVNGSDVTRNDCIGSDVTGSVGEIISRTFFLTRFFLRFFFGNTSGSTRKDNILACIR
jgi:hypothetical protein